LDTTGIKLHYSPNTVIKITRNPLTDKIPGLIRVYERMVAVYVRNIEQGFSLNYLSRQPNTNVPHQHATHL
jgi:hypothetical protein